MGQTSSIITPSMVVIVGRAPAVKKSVMFFLFFFCLSLFGMTKFVKTETLWSGGIFNTIMVSLHRGRFVVVHLYSTFCEPQKISYRGKYIPKIAIFRDFWGCRLTFLKSQNGEIWCEGADLGLPHKPNFIKIG